MEEKVESLIEKAKRLRAESIFNPNNFSTAKISSNLDEAETGERGIEINFR
jgi:hypothetical protein